MPITPGTSRLRQQANCLPAGFNVDAVEIEQSRLFPVDHRGRCVARASRGVQRNVSTDAAPRDGSAAFSSCTRMPRSWATAAALMRFTFSDPCKVRRWPRCAPGRSWFRQARRHRSDEWLQCRACPPARGTTQPPGQIDVGASTTYSSWLSEGRFTAFCTTPSLRYSRTCRAI